MPWFKVDDQLHDHRKVRDAGLAAMGLWVVAGSWCSERLTDGFIPDSVLIRFGRHARREANRLVVCGLWTEATRDGEHGYLFHDWEEFQPTKAQVEALKETRRTVGRKGGWASGQARRDQANPKQTPKQIASGDRSKREAKSNPVPVPVPKPSLGSLVSRLQEVDGRAVDDDEVQQWRRTAGAADLEAEAAAFLAYNNGSFDDLRRPTAAWHAWLVKAAERGRPTPTPDSLADLADEMDTSTWCEHQNPPRTCHICRREAVHS